MDPAQINYAGLKAGILLASAVAKSYFAPAYCFSNIGMPLKNNYLLRIILNIWVKKNTSGINI